MSGVVLRQIEMDMNNPTTLGFYRQLIVFQHDTLQTEIIFPSPSNEEQRTIQSLAHSLGLDFEYSSTTRTARVVRPPVNEPLPPEVEFQPSHVFQDLDYDLSGFDFATDFDMMSVDISGTSFDLGVGESEMLPPTLQPSHIMLPESISTLSPTPTEAFSSDLNISSQLPVEVTMGNTQPYDSQAFNPSPDLDYPMISSKIEGPPPHMSTLEQPAKRICVDPEIIRSHGSTEPSPECTREGVSRLTNLECISTVNPTLIMSPSLQQSSPNGPQLTSPGSPHSRGRSGSISSVQSHRSENKVQRFIRRRSSLIGKAVMGYQEIVFDSARSSVHSGSSLSPTESTTSAASGRRAPLSDIARAGMNIMRKMGACWRCKFLRKTCDPKSPCGMCPRKSSQTGWVTVGCQRGTFEEMALLCPAARRIVIVSEESANYVGAVPAASVSINKLHDEELVRRSQELAVLRCPEYDPMKDLRFKDTGICDLLQAALGHPVEAAMPPSLEPLSHCLLDIIWEFCMYGPYLPCSPSELEGLRSVISVLFAAVKFQAAPKTQSQSDQLIAQSLICLRSCLEASRVKDAVQQPAQFEPRTHNQCLPETCVIDCIASVNTNISLYNKELSRVFFSKENMRDKKPWWLSTFYSLYIQSLVKRTLRILEKDLKHSSPRIGTTYLQLPLRLFVASMGSYDPILVREIPTGDASTTDNGGVDDAAVSAYEEARLVLGQATWSGRGIRSSADYLCMLFEDDGMPMVTSDSPTHRSADEDIKLGESTHIEVVTS